MLRNLSSLPIISYCFERFLMYQLETSGGSLIRVNLFLFGNTHRRRI